MTLYKSLLINCILPLSYILNAEECLDEVCSVDANGEQHKVKQSEAEADSEVESKPPPKHPNALDVIFENQSGKPVDLFWDDSKDGILQGSLAHTNQITINTFLGHRFYYAPANCSKSKEEKIYEVIMEEHTGLVTLYDPGTMSERGKDFERKKSVWMKEYYERTGRRWHNYWPREPITHHYYNVAETGDVVEAKTDRSTFMICTEGQVTDDNKASLDEMEREWDTEGRDKQISKKCREDPEAEDCHLEVVPPSFQTENDQYFVGRMNGTEYCRRKTSQESDAHSDGAGKWKWDVINICNHGPHAFRVYDFLSEDEMEHIKILGQYLGLKRSTVSEEALETLDRTSQTVWVERSRSFIVDNVVRRIADIVNIDESLLYLNSSSESLQLVHYFGGELYKAHVDYGTDRPHNRFVTFLMYLSDVGEGGNTSFPRADEKCLDENGYFGVQPIKGSVMFFYNLFPDGNVDVTTQHYAEPPVDSEKWMTNLWIWDKVFTR